MKNRIHVDKIDISVLTDHQRKLFLMAFRQGQVPMRGAGIESHVAFSHGGKYMHTDILAMGWKTCAIKEFLESHPKAEPTEREMKRLMAIIARAEVLLGIVSLLGGK